MTVLALIAYFSTRIVGWAYVLLQWTAVLVGVLALIDVLRRPAEHFPVSGKRTKGFWTGVNAAGLAAVVLLGQGSMLGLLGFVANGVYLADVRPALDLHTPVRVRSQVRRAGNGTQSRPTGRGRGTGQGDGTGSGSSDWRR